MKSQRKIFGLFSLIIFALLLTSTAHADRRKIGILHDIRDILPCPIVLLDHADEFNLTEDQAVQIKKLKYSFKKAKTKTKADIKILEIELRELLDMKTVDKKTVEEKIEAIGELYVQKAKKCVSNRLEVRKLLTDEQLKKWETFGNKARSYNYYGRHEKHDKRGHDKRSGSSTK